MIPSQIQPCMQMKNGFLLFMVFLVSGKPLLWFLPHFYCICRPWQVPRPYIITCSATSWGTLCHSLTPRLRYYLIANYWLICLEKGSSEKKPFKKIFTHRDVFWTDLEKMLMFWTLLWQCLSVVGLHVFWQLFQHF